MQQISEVRQRGSSCTWARAIAVASWFLVVSPPVGAQAPSTDIVLLELRDEGDGMARIESVVRVTERDAYDNQPAFLDEHTLLFTAMEAAGDDQSGSAQTELVRYDIARRETVKLVTSPENEYSPTPMPGGDQVSFVRDFGNLRQELWSVPTSSIDRRSGIAQPEENLLPHVTEPIGYHAWVDSEQLVLFVLGEPATLRWVDRGGAERILAEQPGRALARIPNAGESVSFVQKGTACRPSRSDDADDADDADNADNAVRMPEDGSAATGHDWWLCQIRFVRRPGGGGLPSSTTFATLLRMPDGVEDYAWSPEGAVWSSEGTRLVRSSPILRGETEWTEVADLSSYGLRGISRLAFSPSGDRLAVVVEYTSAGAD